MDIKILGFGGNIDSVNQTLAKINSLKNNDDEIIQLLNADAIAGLMHVKHGVNQAYLAFSRAENLAKDLSVEVCLRCSAQRQISRAFEILGLKEGKMNLCAILINCSNEIVDELSLMFDRDDDVLIADESKLIEIYDINDDELTDMDIEDIIIDKITKLTVDY
jgi:KEOPS complex subunit Cgi121